MDAQSVSPEGERLDRLDALVEGYETPAQPNAEKVNDRVKLLFHRLIARRLGQDPSLIALARQELERQRQRHPNRNYIREWEMLLSLDVATLRHEIIRRDERMTRLRISSPLGPLINVSDPDLRRRIWRSARRALAGWSGPSRRSAEG